MAPTMKRYKVWREERAMEKRKMADEGGSQSPTKKKIRIGPPKPKMAEEGGSPSSTESVTEEEMQTEPPKTKETELEQPKSKGKMGRQWPKCIEKCTESGLRIMRGGVKYETYLAKPQHHTFLQATVINDTTEGFTRISNPLKPGLANIPCNGIVPLKHKYLDDIKKAARFAFAKHKKTKEFKAAFRGKKTILTGVIKCNGQMQYRYVYFLTLQICVEEDGVADQYLYYETKVYRDRFTPTHKMVMDFFREARHYKREDIISYSYNYIDCCEYE